jgi:hypothetical protein
LVGDQRKRFGGCNHIVCITPIIGKASDLCIAACKEVSTSTGFTVATLATMPAYTYSLSSLLFNYIFTYLIDNTCYLMTRNPWICDARE